MLMTARYACSGKDRAICALSLALTVMLAACSGGGAGSDVLSTTLLAQVAVVNGVATFSGKRSEYVVTRTATGYTVQNSAGSSEVINARTLQFSDVNIDLSIADKAASIAATDLKALTELYVAYFNRLPDAEGLAYWIDRFKGGLSLDEIGKAFFDAALQYPALTGYASNTNDTDFIRIVYKNVLGRTTVDAEGLAYWTNALASGKETRASLIRSILNVAHELKGDSTYGWVADLLDNKAAAAMYFAVQQGITYTLPEQSISNTMAIAAAVTAGDAGAANRMTDTIVGSSASQTGNSNMTAPQAVRLLLQAQFSASDAEIASVRSQGAAAWLNAQMNAPAGISGWNWLDSRGYNVISNDTRYYDMEYVSDRMIWSQLMTAPDAVRKRMALALSEQFVVSVSGVELTWRAHAMASYWDALSANAFGNFRTLLEDVSLNVATGKFLNTLGSQKENAAGNQPDENYAREVMQLYTIGLVQLNLDGSEQRDSSGNKIETYTASDVSNLARVFTGYVSRNDPNPPVPVPQDSNRTIRSTIVVKPPMLLNASQHSMLAVNFLNTSIPANTDGATALRIALDGLFNHPNVGPFFAKQMIQRLVTSNPSPAYVARVATVFNNNGKGVRGDLGAVFKAILLDDDARSEATLTQNGTGKLREPMLRLVQWGRTFADLATRDRWKIGDQSNPSTQLGQSPLHAASVFNFFRPGYVPPSTAIATTKRVAPEFQIVNESTVGGYLNTIESVIRYGLWTPNSDVTGNTAGGVSIPAPYTGELALATDASALVARLNLLLCAGQLLNETQTLIVQALNATPVTATSSANAKLNRVTQAVFLVMASPEYLIQK